MQHMKRKLTELFRGKGYYIALILCVAAVGVSGYLFTSSLAKQNERAPLADAQLTVPPVVTEADAPTVQLPVVQKPAVPAAVNDMTPAPGPQETEPAPETEATPTVLRTVSPVEGEISAAYSMDRLSYNVTTRDWRTHDGVDLAAEPGTPVVAAADGTVEAVFTDDFLGRTVRVRHDGGYVTQYSNLADEVAVGEGDAVKAGDLLGTVGATALLEIGAPAHLHFAVTRSNVPVDPLKFLDMA